MMTEVIGEAELQGKFDALLALGTSDELTDAMMRGGTILEAQVKRNIRKQGLVDTGNLRSSVAVAKLAAGLVAVFTNVVYAAIHEFGGLAGRGRSVNIPARPYFRPAIDEARNDITDAVGDVLIGLIRRITG